MEWVGEEKLRSVSFSCCIFQNFILLRDQDHKCTATNVQKTERIRKINLIYTDEHCQWRQAYVVMFTVKKKSSFGLEVPPLQEEKEEGESNCGLLLCPSGFKPGFS